MGPDRTDGSGTTHPGITRLPIPILAASRDHIKQVALQGLEDPRLDTVPFNDVAQQSKNYDDYGLRLSGTPFEHLNYIGVLLVGPKKAVSRLTGGLPLATE